MNLWYDIFDKRMSYHFFVLLEYAHKMEYAHKVKSLEMASAETECFRKNKKATYAENYISC